MIHILRVRAIVENPMENTWNMKWQHGLFTGCMGYHHMDTQQWYGFLVTVTQLKLPNSNTDWHSGLIEKATTWKGVRIGIQVELESLGAFGNPRMQVCRELWVHAAVRVLAKTIIRDLALRLQENYVLVRGSFVAYVHRKVL